MAAPGLTAATPHRLVRPYLAGVFATATAVGVLAVWDLWLTRPRIEHLWLVAVLTALLLGAETRPIQWLRTRSTEALTVSFVYSFALAFLLPGYSAALVVAAASAIGDRTNGKPPLKLAFNAAMMLLSMAAGTAVLRLGGAQGLLATGPPGPGFAMTALLAAAVVYVANNLLTALVLALHSGLTVRAALRRLVLTAIRTDGILLLTSPVLAAVGILAPALFPFMLLVPLAVLYASLATAAQERQAISDPLTGLHNRRRFEEAAEELLGDVGPDTREATLLLIDLNGFKDVNDTWGHHTGDELLCVVAERLQATVPDAAVIARLGGDEFAVLLDHGVQGQARTAAAAAVEVDRALREPVHLGEAVLEVSGSLGIAVHPDHGTTLTALVRAADEAMYEAKRTGQTLVTARAPQHERSFGLLHDLGRALRNGGEELDVHYQPIIDVRTRAAVGLEALIRWTHPVRGPVSPVEFIPRAESTALIHGLTDHVLDRALALLAGLHGDGHLLGMSVNISSRDLADAAFPDRVAAALRHHGVEDRWLTLEVTETTFMEHVETCVATCERLAAMGVVLALDDFGSGHSSLARLRDLPVTVIKLDRAFTAEAQTDHGLAFMRAVLEMSRALGLHTVAEGVDSRVVLHTVGALQYDDAQGHIVAAPMDGAAIGAWLAGRSSLDPAGRVVAPHEDGILAPDPGLPR